MSSKTSESQPAVRLRRVIADALPLARRDPLDVETLAAAGAIVSDVRERGEDALREHAERLGDLAPGAPLVIARPDLVAALGRIPAGQRALLERTAGRIADFAKAQRSCLTELTLPLLGGSMGHRVTPLQAAGCYAPGGRYPLPSSVLMTCVTARAAGVQTVWVASPRPEDVTLAAAAVAGADALLAVGGAQAIAAFAFGAGPVPACDVVVGPGNRWVTAAKQLVAGRVRIDMLAGPSELVVLADGSADPALVAADLLAQAEHDPDALPVLVTTDEALLVAVEGELARQLSDLSTAGVAREAVGGGFAVVAASLDDAVAVCNRLAPEHLEVLVRDPDALVPRLTDWGGLFIGAGAAEVLGDYGAGPNHVLPTSGTARSFGGLSVQTFSRIHTWMRVDGVRSAAGLAADARDLARLEGLEAHARAAEHRL